ncbi:MAG: hypothetical protein RLY93_20950 [Sumerlaeia bacterium]
MRPNSFSLHRLLALAIEDATDTDEPGSQELRQEFEKGRLAMELDKAREANRLTWEQIAAGAALSVEALHDLDDGDYDGLSRQELERAIEFCQKADRQGTEPSSLWSGELPGLSARFVCGLLVSEGRRA